MRNRREDQMWSWSVGAIWSKIHIWDRQCTHRVKGGALLRTIGGTSCTWLSCKVQGEGVMGLSSRARHRHCWASCCRIRWDRRWRRRVLLIRVTLQCWCIAGLLTRNKIELFIMQVKQALKIRGGKISNLHTPRSSFIQPMSRQLLVRVPFIKVGWIERSTLSWSSTRIGRAGKSDRPSSWDRRIIFLALLKMLEVPSLAQVENILDS
jgi:hypothetical protein